MLLHWQKTFELGQPAADAEHREVVELLNALDRFLSGDHHPPTIVRTLESLIGALERHFGQEYPPSRRMLDRARQIHHAWCRDDATPSRDDIRSLAQWWLLHLCRHVHGTANLAP